MAETEDFGDPDVEKEDGESQGESGKFKKVAIHDMKHNDCTDGCGVEDSSEKGKRVCLGLKTTHVGGAACGKSQQVNEKSKGVEGETPGAVGSNKGCAEVNNMGNGPLVSFVQAQSTNQKYEKGCSSKSSAATKKWRPISSTKPKHSEPVQRQILVGLISEDAEKLTSNIGSSSSQTKYYNNDEYVVVRSSPNAELSFSICNGENPALCDVSVDDSGIVACCERWKAEYEVSVANKIWSFERTNLGVVGSESDEAHVEKIKAVDRRD